MMILCSGAKPSYARLYCTAPDYGIDKSVGYESAGVNQLDMQSKVVVSSLDSQ